MLRPVPSLLASHARMDLPLPPLRSVTCHPLAHSSSVASALHCAVLRWSLCDGSVATVALSYYKGERAMIDCVQEYEQRAKLKARKQRQMREEAAAAAAAQ